MIGKAKADMYQLLMFIALIASLGFLFTARHYMTKNKWDKSFYYTGGNVLSNVVLATLSIPLGAAFVIMWVLMIALGITAMVGCKKKADLRDQW